MSLIVFLGRPGAGKSYSALQRYVLPALKQGRRVLHNIGGLDLPNCHNYGSRPLFPRVTIADNADLVFHSPLTHVLDKNGNLLLERSVFIKQPPNAYGVELLKEFPGDPILIEEESPAQVRAGDLVIIDEFYLVADAAEVNFGSRSRNDWLEGLLTFLRAHRHFVNDKTGFGTDVILMSQSDHDLPVGMRQVIEKTHICKTAILSSSFSKMIHKGLTGKSTGNKLRRLDYDGFRPMKGASAANAILVHEYFPTEDIFKYYRSYSGKAVVEQNRGFSAGAVVRAPLIMFCVCILVGIYFFPAILDVIGLGGDDEEVVAEQQDKPPPAAVVVWRDICRLRIDGICNIKGRFVVK